jgi:hypothetical protein
LTGVDGVTTSAAVAEIDFASTVRVVKLSEGDGTCTTLAEGASGAVYVGGLAIDTAGEDVTLTPPGGLMLAFAATPPAPDEESLHVWSGSAGAVTCAATSKVCLEDNQSHYIEYLAPNNAFAGFRFSDVAADAQGQLIYGNSAASVSNRFLLYAETIRILDIGVGVMEHKQATTYSTTAGNLTLHPAGVVTANTSLFFSSVNGPRIVNENVTATNPTLLPFGSDTDTGIGAQTDSVALVSGGVTMLQCPEDTADTCITKVGVAYTPSGDQSVLDDGVISCNNNGIARVVGNGGPVTLSTTSIASPLHDGQICIIQGTDNTNTVTINDNTNVQLAGGVAFTLSQGDTLQIIFDSGDTEWYEVSRSAN